MSTSQFLIRLSTDEHERMKAAASKAGLSLNTWALGVLLVELDGTIKAKGEPKAISSAPVGDITRTPQAATPQPKAGYSTGHKPGCRCLLCNPPKD